MGKTTSTTSQEMMRMVMNNALPAICTLQALESAGKAERLAVTANPAVCAIAERWRVGKHTGVLFMDLTGWEFYAPIVPTDAENATLSAIEHMAEAE